MTSRDGVLLRFGLSGGSRGRRLASARVRRRVQLKRARIDEHAGRAASSRRGRGGCPWSSGRPARSWAGAWGATAHRGGTSPLEPAVPSAARTRCPHPTRLPLPAGCLAATKYENIMIHNCITKAPRRLELCDTTCGRTSLHRLRAQWSAGSAGRRQVRLPRGRPFAQCRLAAPLYSVHRSPLSRCAATRPPARPPHARHPRSPLEPGPDRSAAKNSPLRAAGRTHPRPRSPRDQPPPRRRLRCSPLRRRPASHNQSA